MRIVRRKVADASYFVKCSSFKKWENLEVYFVNAVK